MDPIVKQSISVTGKNVEEKVIGGVGICVGLNVYILWNKTVSQCGIII